MYIKIYKPSLFQRTAHNVYDTDFSAFLEIHKIVLQYLPACAWEADWTSMFQLVLMKSEDLTGMFSMDKYSKNILRSITSAERMKCNSTKELGQCMNW